MKSNNKKAVVPKGTDLLATLINLLADQEGVKIEYKIEEVGKTKNSKNTQAEG